MIIIICEFIVLLGRFVFVCRRKPLLSILYLFRLCVLIFTFLHLLNFESYFKFLSLEGSLGLSLLVSDGNDYFQTFNVL